MADEREAVLPEDEDFVPPALFGHCCNTYEAMLQEAKPVTIGSEGDEDARIMVYEGFLTQLITNKLNLSVPYYSSILQALQNMGCIRQLKRGGGTAPSQWELVYEPTVEAFMRQTKPKQPKQDKWSMQTQQMIALTNRVSALEKLTHQLVEALAQQRGVEEAPPQEETHDHV